MSSDMDDIQAIFFEECAEGLAAAEQGLQAMQAGDVSAETIAGVFRAVHSIKGGAGAFGHTALTAFAHRFENLLEEVRGGRIDASAGVTRLMLSAFDVLSDHVEAAQTGGAAPEDAAMLDALDAALHGKGVTDSPAPAAPSAPAPTPPAAPPSEPDPFGFEPVGVTLDDLDAPVDSGTGSDGGPAPWRVRFRPSRAALANASEPLLTLRELELIGGRVTDVDTSALPDLRAMDAEQGYFTWTILLPGTVEEAAIIDCFDFVPPDSVIDIARDAAMAALAPAAADTGAAQAAPPPASAELIALPVKPQPEAAGDDVTPTAENSPTPAPRAAEPVQQSIRVDLTKLDLLFNLVGELVIRNSILADRLSAADQQRVELPELARLTRQIQDSVMSLRAQPIRQAFSRVPRMMRDLSAETGKQVVLETFGETTEIDKGVIEKIGEPLTHLIRNAVDHGLESTEARIAAGKPAHGTIRLSAEQKGARIFVSVSDDGGGINRERVRAKAIEKGIIAADAQLSDEEIDYLICAPGFSTATQISNISGRGVGMDVVRSNVEALGGRVEIQSTPGVGTRFTMILPLTLAILDGMIVRIAGQRFVLPLVNVIETIQPEPGQITRTSPHAEVIDVRGEYLPVRRAMDIFGMHAENHQPADEIVVIVESEHAGHFGLVVDTIDDRREVVIKSLDQNLYPIRGLGGATVLGDGSIALILDVEAFAVAHTAPRYALKGLAA